MLQAGYTSQSRNKYLVTAFDRIPTLSGKLIHVWCTFKEYHCAGQVRCRMVRTVILLDMVHIIRHLLRVFFFSREIIAIRAPNLFFLIVRWGASMLSGWQFGVINHKCCVLIPRKWLLLANPWINVLSLKEYNANYFIWRQACDVCLPENSCTLLVHQTSI